jgi:hypothetical protein
MYGVILFWRVKAEKLAEHVEIMREALQAERERCPELLLNLPFGPSADGTFCAVQVYADEAAYRSLPERVQREDSRLWQLWGATGEISDPSGSRTFCFDGMDWLGEALVRVAAGLGHVDHSGA